MIMSFSDFLDKISLVLDFFCSYLIVFIDLLFSNYFFYIFIGFCLFFILIDLFFKFLVIPRYSYKQYDKIDNQIQKNQAKILYKFNKKNYEGQFIRASKSEQKQMKNDLNSIIEG